MIHHEASLHEAVANYIRLQYPGVVFFSDGSGVNVGARVGARNKRLRSGHRVPILFIAESRGGLHGLFIELKAKAVWLRGDGLSKNKHVQAQNESLDKLRFKGYAAVFGCGFNECKKLIDEYLR